MKLGWNLFLYLYLIIHNLYQPSNPLWTKNLSSPYSFYSSLLRSTLSSKTLQSFKHTTNSSSSYPPQLPPISFYSTVEEKSNVSQNPTSLSPLKNTETTSKPKAKGSLINWWPLHNLKKLKQSGSAKSMSNQFPHKNKNNTMKSFRNCKKWKTQFLMTDWLKILLIFLSRNHDFLHFYSWIHLLTDSLQS